MKEDLASVCLCIHSSGRLLILLYCNLSPPPSLCYDGRILNTTLFESWEIVGPYPSWWVFNLLLILLQLLHSFWSYLIVKTACQAISKGKVSDGTLTSLCNPSFIRYCMIGCCAASESIINV